MDFSKVTLEIFTELEQKWLSGCESRKTRILCIDGGDTSGAAAGVFLVHLEDQIRVKSGDANARITDFFDLVAGTGIGSIYGAMITADDGNGRPMFTASEAVRFVGRNSRKMFTAGSCLFRRKSSRGMSKVLKNILRTEDGRLLTLKDTCKPLLVPCFDLNSSAPFVFSRTDASDSSSFNFELWKVCVASSATPDLFRPFALTSTDGTTSCVAVEGGLVMNNPAAAAVTHILHNKRDFPAVSGIEDLSILSLGNGDPRVSGVRRNGECSTSAVMDIVRNGVSETIDQMLGNAYHWNRADYVRIQIHGCGGGRGDALDERGVESSPFGGKRLLVETNGRRIESFVQRLVAAGRSLPPSPCKQPTATAAV